MEGKLGAMARLAMISRDFFLLLFGLYLSLTGHWESYRFTSISWGKVTTALQFLVLDRVNTWILFSRLSLQYFHPFRDACLC